jgi:hypothetical protein
MIRRVFRGVIICPELFPTDFLEYIDTFLSSASEIHRNIALMEKGCYLAFIQKKFDEALPILQEAYEETSDQLLKADLGRHIASCIYNIGRINRGEIPLRSHIEGIKQEHGNITTYAVGTIAEDDLEGKVLGCAILLGLTAGITKAIRRELTKGGIDAELYQESKSLVLQLEDSIRPLVEQTLSIIQKINGPAPARFTDEERGLQEIISMYRI